MTDDCQTEAIRRLLKHGKFSDQEIARKTGAAIQRVRVVRWRDQRPGYNAGYMAAKRSMDAKYQAQIERDTERRKQKRGQQ